MLKEVKEKFLDIYEETKQYTDSERNTAWIPVGTYHTSSGDKTNNLSRRTFTSTGSTEVNGDNAIDSYYYGEGDSRSISKDTIGTFKTQTQAKGGFYIGRYEQGTGNVCKKNIALEYLTRDQANEQAREMYSENQYVTSELISSYAWDTALNFICQNYGYYLATTTDSKYGNINTNSAKNTGMYTADKYCNMYDMLGNFMEWTTEYWDSGNSNYPCVFRGGRCYPTGFYAAARSGSNVSGIYAGKGFRVQLYVK